MRRSTLVISMIVVGFVVQVVAYFFLAAELGTPTSVANSNPRLQFAPVVFIAGVMLVLIAAIVYELMSDKSSGDD